MKLAIYCLLAILTSTAALAQTHPKKKPVRKHTVVRQVTEKEPPPYGEQRYCIASLRSPDEVTVVPFDSTYVYTYVEQMPTLNGQEACRASIAAINQYLVVPPTAPNGHVFVKFEVGKDGRVSHPQIVKSLRADLDSAVLVATRQLPRFTPGKQNGKVVIVSVTLPITISVKK
jgi:TonB family protein